VSDKLAGTRSDKNSFTPWLLSWRESVEKIAGLVVLAIEGLDFLHSMFYGTSERVYTYVVNLLFLVFVYTQLRKEFDHQFTLTPNVKEISEILRLRGILDKRTAINDLAHVANKLIGQLRAINNFILAEAVLYFVFFIGSLPCLAAFEKKRHVFHLLVDLVSYVGAFYLLRSFFVMYLPTVVKGEDVLQRKTNRYLWLGVVLVAFDVCLTYANAAHAIFIGEFICGVINAVVFVLFAARFETKLLDVPPYMLFILYAYAVLQTCLPFVSPEGGLVGDVKLAEAFASIVLRLVLVGKVALVAVLVYVLSSRRIFYYFMTVKNIFRQEEEEKYWPRFSKLIVGVPRASESFAITYHLEDSGKVAATFSPDLFGVGGADGGTPDEAKGNLLKKVRGAK